MNILMMYILHTHIHDAVSKDEKWREYVLIEWYIFVNKFYQNQDLAGMDDF